MRLLDDISRAAHLVSASPKLSSALSTLGDAGIGTVGIWIGAAVGIVTIGWRAVAVGQAFGRIEAKLDELSTKVDAVQGRVDQERASREGVHAEMWEEINTGKQDLASVRERVAELRGQRKERA